MPIKLISSGGGSVILSAPSTGSTYTLTTPALSANLVSDGDTGTVSTNMLANSSITANKMGYSGAILNISTVRNSTRSSVSAVSSAYTLFSGSFTKVSSTSTLIATCTVFGSGSYSGVCAVGMNIDGSNWDYGCNYQYDNQWQPAQITFIVGTSVWTGISAGSHTLGFGWNAADGSSNRPFNIFNPNSNEDSRSRQQVSSMTIYEVI